MATVDVTTSIIIRRPVAEVAAYSADPDNAPAWYVNIKQVKWETAKPLRVGSRMAFVAKFLGRRLEYVYEVMEYLPGEILAMQTSQGPFPMRTLYTWTPHPDGTRMTLRNRGNVTGFPGVVRPFMSLAMRLANRKDLARLKGLLEAGTQRRK